MQHMQPAQLSLCVTSNPASRFVDRRFSSLLLIPLGQKILSTWRDFIYYLFAILSYLHCQVVSQECNQLEAIDNLLSSLFNPKDGGRMLAQTLVNIVVCVCTFDLLKVSLRILERKNRIFFHTLNTHPFSALLFLSWSLLPRYHYPLSPILSPYIHSLPLFSTHPNFSTHSVPIPLQFPVRRETLIFPTQFHFPPTLFLPCLTILNLLITLKSCLA